ncbi:Vitamin B12-binding protein [compost metagenome]
MIAANPQVILSAAMRHNDDLLKRWQRMPGIAAVQNRQLHQVNGDLLNRPTPRMIAGTRQLCAKLDLARR